MSSSSDGFPDTPDPVPDAPEAPIDLLLLSCLAAIPDAARIALTLHLVSGVPTTDLAKAFGVSTSAMEQRLARAEERARAQLPMSSASAVTPTSLNRVLSVLIAIFDDGYTHPHLSTNVDLPARAVALARIVVDSFPQSSEARALLAFMLMVRARRDVHLAPDGSSIPLGSQDRTRWRRDEIEEGLFHVRRSRGARPPGPYELLASIQATHVVAASSAETDWAHILTLYDQLLAAAPSVTFALNRIAAVAEVHGPERALQEVEQMTAESHLFHATRASLLNRMGRHEEADRAWTAAVARSHGAAEHEEWKKRAER